jgi:hypothetical protein
LLRIRPIRSTIAATEGLSAFVCASSALRIVSELKVSAAKIDSDIRRRGPLVLGHVLDLLNCAAFQEHDRNSLLLRSN